MRTGPNPPCGAISRVPMISTGTPQNSTSRTQNRPLGRPGIRLTATLKELCGRRERKYGHLVVEFATPGIGHVLKGAGCDFVLFDTEHSGFGFETIKSAIRYFEAAQLPAIVRVPSKAYDQIARAADMGAEGIMVPMIDTGAEARDLVSYRRPFALTHKG